MGYTGNVNKTEKPELIMYYSTSYRKTDGKIGIGTTFGEEKRGGFGFRTF